MKKIILSLIFLTAACSQETTDTANGYMEGEYVYISPSTSGVLEEIYVVKGQDIKIGENLFSIDSQTLQADIDSAKLALEKANANFANLSKGKRPEEILVILKQKEQAEAALLNSKQEFERSEKLFKSTYGTKADLDLKKANLDQAQGKVDELKATLKTAMLAARDDELKMAQNEIDIAKQNLLKAEKRYRDSHPTAKVSGKVEDVYYRLGEMITAGSPVVNILPPENIKARFFVSQKQLPKLKVGKNIYINCDGCENKIEAKITFISSQAEFTPPVIYSVESREKLVFMIEAVPLEFNPKLRPGLPINITLE